MQVLVWFICVMLAFTAGYFVNSWPKQTQVCNTHARERPPAKITAEQDENVAANINKSEPNLSKIQTQNKNQTLPISELAGHLSSLISSSSDPTVLSFSQTASVYTFVANLPESQLLGLLQYFSSTNFNHNSTEFSALFSRYAELNPTKAIDFALTEIDDESTKTGYLATGLDALGMQDPIAAYDYFLQLNHALPSQTSHNQQMPTGGLVTTFAGLAKLDMALAIDKLNELNQLGYRLSTLVWGLTQALESKHDFVDLLTLTKAIDDHEVEESIIQEWARKSPEEVGAWLVEDYSGNRYDELKSRFISSWSYQDREKSGDWLIAHTAQDKLDDDVVNFMRSWSWHSPEAAMEWFKQQPEKVHNQRNFGEFINSVAVSQPQFAAKYLGFVDSKTKQADISRSIYRGLKRRSTSQATAFLEQSPLKNDILELEAESSR